MAGERAAHLSFLGQPVLVFQLSPCLPPLENPMVLLGIHVQRVVIASVSIHPNGCGHRANVPALGAHCMFYSTGWCRGWRYEMAIYNLLLMASMWGVLRKNKRYMTERLTHKQTHTHTHTLSLSFFSFFLSLISLFLSFSHISFSFFLSVSFSFFLEGCRE